VDLAGPKRGVCVPCTSGWKQFRSQDRAFGFSVIPSGGSVPFAESSNPGKQLRGLIPNQVEPSPGL